MKTGLIICGSDITDKALALLSGTFEEKVTKAAEMGYDGIELMVRDPAELDWEQIKAAVEKSGLEIPQIVTGELYGIDGLCLVTSDQDLYRRSRERTHLVIDMAAYLGAMMNIGRLRGRLEFLKNVDDPQEIVMERLCEIFDYAKDKGVKITLEPINRNGTDFIFSAQDGMDFIKDLEYDNVGLMLDVAHMNMEDDSIEGGLRLAGDKLWHVHITDSNRRYPGSGDLDFDSIFATLKDMGYEEYVSAEIVPYPDPDTAAQKTIDFLRKYDL